MKNELLALEHLIKVVLNPAKLTAKDLHENFLMKHKQFAEMEMERIKQCFHVVAVEPGSKSCLKIYIRQQQTYLLTLSDTVFSYLKLTGPESIHLLSTDASILKLYEAVGLVPENLLQFIEKSYPNHFDVSMCISKSRRANERKGIIHCLKRVKKETKGCAIHDDLLAILCSPFENFLLPDKTISYQELAYLLSLKSGIHTYHGIRKVQTNEELCAVLIFLNNNSLRFFSYITMLHHEAAKNFHTTPDLILYYHLQLKLTNQQSVRPGMVFKPLLPSMKDQIANWLHEEIHYHEKQLQLQSKNINASTTIKEKISTSLSVAELALFMKLLQDAKLIKSDNSTDLMNFIANNVRTERSAAISPGSLRNKFYNVESSTVNSMKGVIKDLMNRMTGY